MNTEFSFELFTNVIALQFTFGFQSNLL